jgi:4-hydroxy-2-oxoheptanedioate aldolase
MGDTQAVNRVLDSGAHGVLFPCIATGDEAERMARSLWFAPRGTRGWGGRHVRAVRWNTTSPDLSTSEYVESVNAAIANVMMIETPEGVDNVEEILARGTPHAVIFGLADYSVAVGFDDESTEAAARRVYAACRAHAIGLGLLPGSLGAPPFAPGDFCVAGVDSLLINDAIGRRIAAVRDTVLAAR